MKNLSQVLLISMLLPILSCSQTKRVKSTSAPHRGTKAKNVILMIGDGMGPGQISLLYHFIKNSKTAKRKNIKYAFDRFNKGSFGISITAPHDKIVVDSACSATQLAIGESSRSEMIGLNKDGNTTLTILEKAQKNGLATGLVSDTRMTHATPASFASHVANRWSEDKIAQGMIETAPDVLFSGGANRFYPKNYNKKIDAFKIKSRREDNKNLIKDAKLKNYQVLHTRQDFKNIKADKKLLGLFTNHDFPNGIWFKNEKNNPKRKIPTLLEMSKVAIKKLEQNTQGFFLMIEGGQIDWAAHQNDAGTMLQELLSFNETVNWVLDWVEKNPETLLLVTADHETGGFGLGYSVNSLPSAIKLSGDKFKQIPFKPLLDYGNYDILDNLYAQKKSFKKLFKKFSKKPKHKQTLKKLKKMIEKNSGHPITLEQAKDVLTEVKNEFQLKGHKLLKVDKLPKFHGQQEFYFNSYDAKAALIGRAIAPKQNVVWGTGGHTATAVHVYSMGAKSLTERFSGQITHPEIGKRLQDVLGL